MNVVILLYEGVTALDAVGPYEVLSLVPGATVQFAAAEAGPVRTDSGFLTLHADYRLADVSQPDVIVVPGSATHTRRAMEDARILDWLRGAHEKSKWTTSVCSGALILGAAGLLRGKKASTHWVAREYLAALGAEPVAERVVEQGKIITAAGVSAGIDMALHLAARLAGEEQARIIQLIMEYDPQPPFDSGSKEKATPEIVEKAARQLTNMRTSAAGRRAGG
jgi:transcriptional regulator GlxA family with amidase domain